MEKQSIFDIFKIGVGPSSSHTLGPWKAASEFITSLSTKSKNLFIEVYLYGSLAKTGIGHGTDIAVQLGLMGYDYQTIDTNKISEIIEHLKKEKQFKTKKYHIQFDPEKNIHFIFDTIPKHPNTINVKAYENGKNLISDETYFSVGGGFIVQKVSTESNVQNVDVPFPAMTGQELSKHCKKNNMSVSNVVLANEKSFQSEKEIDKKTQAIFQTMKECLYEGCKTEGYLPGGLDVKRRAKDLFEKIIGNKIPRTLLDWERTLKSLKLTFDSANLLISCFALAVNEVNASMGRVVTSPTNGAAGVIPSVLFYHYFINDDVSFQDIKKFLFTAGMIGLLFKNRATLSAAVGGCQAEIGVSSAMAAAGLTEIKGGTVEQVLMAAEIAMEHHLGLTCDPVGGLVQIPCIERNSMGANKATTASNLALACNPKKAKVNFDSIVQTMWETAQDMNSKYKETAEGGLANIITVRDPNC